MSSSAERKERIVILNLLKSKIHAAKVTEANLQYMGSITIDRALIEAAGILENERVQVVDNESGARLETYVIPGERGSPSSSCATPSSRRKKRQITSRLSSWSMTRTTSRKSATSKSTGRSDKKSVDRKRSSPLQSKMQRGARLVSFSDIFHRVAGIFLLELNTIQ